VAVATVDIQINSQGAVRNLNQVGVASKSTQSALQKLDGVVGSLAASFAAGFAINRIISDVKELDTNIRRLGTVGVNVAKINPALSALSDRLGGVANKAELAAASYQAASAGFSDTAGNIRILEAATKAATGGLADNQGVTEVLVKTLNAYGMSGTEAYKVTDSISKAVELGNQEWSDYVSQLGRVASMAALSGVSLDEMNAFIASATKNGATAEVAFTGLSAVLTQLLQPTKESQTAAAKLGIQWNLMGLQTKGLGGLMKELAVAIDRDKEAAARMVGPTEAMRGAFAAASKDGKDFSNILGQIGNASGKTDADFQTMKGSLENTFKALDTSFKNLSEALGKAFGPTLVIVIQDITKGVNGFASAMNTVPQPVMNAVGTLIKAVVQLILVQKAIQGVIALRVGFTAAMTAFAATTAASGTAAATSSSAFALYTANTRTVALAAAAATPQVTALGTALRGLAQIGIITIAVNIAVYGVQALMQARAELDRLRGANKQKGGAAASFGGSATKEQKAVQQKVKQQIQEERKLLQATQAFGIGRALGNTREKILSEREKSANAILGLPDRVAPRVTNNPPNTQTSVPSAPSTGTGRAKKTPKPKDFTEQIANSKTALNLANLQFAAEGKILEARRLANEPLALALTAQKEIYKINADVAKIKADKDMPNAQKLNEIAALEIQRKTITRQLTYDIATAEQTAGQTRLEAITAYLEKQYELNTAIQQQKALAESVSTTLGQGMTSVFDLLIQGSDNWGKSLQQIASKVLVDIANQLIRIYVIEQAVSAIKSFLSPALPFGGGGGQIGGVGTLGPNYGIKQFANGGVPPVGRPSLVGERGPELFMPGIRGTVIPNGGFGGGSTNIVVNVDASGNSNVQGDQAQAKQLGVAVSAAVQAELVKQQRPGGLLAGTRR
jgi:TP901 family phage tail tape measure protein